MAGLLGLLSDAAELTSKTTKVAPKVAKAGEVMSIPAEIAAQFMKAADPAHIRGAEVMDMLKSGRGSEVTDQMLDMGDPVLNARLNEYLYKNADIPMDEASRMARAKQMGIDFPAFHSTLKDTQTVNPTGKFMGYTGTSGFSVTDSPKAASRYLDRFGDYGWVDNKPNQQFNKNVMPLQVRLGNVDERAAPYPSRIGLGYTLPDGYIPEHVQRGFDTARFEDAISKTGQVKHSTAKNAIRSSEYVISDPTRIRSRFARFDPRLSHLKNLSASVGAGLLGANMMPNNDGSR